MALPHFDFPDSSSPTTTFTFSRGNLFPHSERREKSQGISVAESGKMKVASIGTFHRIWTLVFQNLNTTDKTNLASFIETTVNFAESTFDYTDHDGTAYTVRLINQPTWTETSADLFSITLELREEIT